MPDSPINPQAPSIEPLADVRARARDALIDPDFRPAALPDPVLLELVVLAYRERAADRLEGAAGELLRRLRCGAPVGWRGRRAPDHADLEAPPAVHDGADRAQDGHETPCGTALDQAVPVDGGTREAVHDILMAALEQGLAVLPPPTQATQDPFETQRDTTVRQPSGMNRPGPSSPD